MPWTATTDHDALAAGATLRIALGPSDVPPQPGQKIALSRGGGGAETILTVVSAAADRLEVTDGRQNLVLKPHAVTKPTIRDADGEYRDAWIVA